MAQRFHLEQVDSLAGTVWFTLVYESPSDFFVERHNDSNLPFLSDRVKSIKPTDFDKYQVNGVPLKKLVAAKLEEIYTRDMTSIFMRKNAREIEQSPPEEAA